MIRSAFALAAVAIALIIAPAPSGAQSIRPEVRAAIAPGNKVIRLVTRWGDKGGVELHGVTKKSISLHTGEATGTVVAGHGGVIVALAVNHREKPFRIGRLEGSKLGDPTTLARPTSRYDFPFAVAATATPTGFAIFFQEVEGDNPSNAHTYLVTLNKLGVPQGSAKEIPVPWSLAAAVWNGNGYHLALLYPGDQRGMRLSMVSTTVSGQPQQHPDWASAPGYIKDVHLERDKQRVRAFYRGGSGGNRLLESDVTAVRAWGSEPPKAKDHGALPADKAIAVANGSVRRVTGARLR